MGLCGPLIDGVPKPTRAEYAKAWPVAPTLRWRNATWRVPPRCSVEFTMRVLHGFDVVGFVDRMDLVWAAVRDWAEARLSEPQRGAYLARLSRRARAPTSRAHLSLIHI